MQRTDSLKKTLMLGKIESKDKGMICGCGWGGWLTITESMNMNLNKLWEMVKDREGWFAAVYEVTKIQTQLNNWTTTK